jgi:hypothetical protein
MHRFLMAAPATGLGTALTVASAAPASVPKTIVVGPGSPFKRRCSRMPKISLLCGLGTCSPSLSPRPDVQDVRPCNPEDQNAGHSYAAMAPLRLRLESNDNYAHADLADMHSMPT